MLYVRKNQVYFFDKNYLFPRQDFDRKADAKSTKHGGFRYHIKVSIIY